jgi:hypothetical protein
MPVELEFFLSQVYCLATPLVQLADCAGETGTDRCFWSNRIITQLTLLLKDEFFPVIATDLIGLLSGAAWTLPESLRVTTVQRNRSIQ